MEEQATISEKLATILEHGTIRIFKSWSDATEANLNWGKFNIKPFHWGFKVYVYHDKSNNVVFAVIFITNTDTVENLTDFVNYVHSKLDI